MHLGRGHRGEPERGADVGLDRGLDAPSTSRPRPRACRPRSPSRARASRDAVALRLQAQQRELRAERRRLGEHAVRPAGDGDVDRLARPRGERRDERARVAGEHVEGARELEAQRGVDDVRGREPVVHPDAPRGSPSARWTTSTNAAVSWRVTASRASTSATNAASTTGAAARHARGGPVRGDAERAPGPRRASSSTSSIAANRASSLKQRGEVPRRVAGDHDGALGADGDVASHLAALEADRGRPPRRRGRAPRRRSAPSAVTARTRPPATTKSVARPCACPRGRRRRRRGARRAGRRRRAPIAAPVTDRAGVARRGEHDGHRGVVDEARRGRRASPTRPPRTGRTGRRRAAAGRPRPRGRRSARCTRAPSARPPSTMSPAYRTPRYSIPRAVSSSASGSTASPMIARHERVVDAVGAATPRPCRRCSGPRRRRASRL